MLTAFIDESMRRRNGEDTCAYVLAAVLVDDEDLEDVRNALKALRYKRSTILHWRKERPERLPIIARRLAELPIVGIVTACLHGKEIPSQRARHLCLAGLLTELASNPDVADVVMESRQAQDDEELKLILALRRAKCPGADLPIRFLMASAEPALWAVDCVAGIVSWWLDGNGTHWEVLKHKVKIVDVEVP